jgi:hypothetical protein
MEAQKVLSYCKIALFVMGKTRNRVIYPQKRVKQEIIFGWL